MTGTQSAPTDDTTTDQVEEPDDLRACITGIAVLNGHTAAAMDTAERQEAWDRLAGQLADLGVEAPALIPADEAAAVDGVVLRVELDGEQWNVDADGDWTPADDGEDLAKRKPPKADDDDEDDDDDPDDEDGPKGKKMPPWLKKKVKGKAKPKTDHDGDTVVAAAGDQVEHPHLVPWSGVLCVEGIETGDGRLFQQGSLWWDESLMPQDLFSMLKDPDGGEGHDGAEICGRIDRIWREPHPTSADMNLIMGEGVYDTKLAAGAEVARLQTQGMLTGVSIDVDSVQVELAADDGEDIAALLGMGSTRFAKGRIRRATVCSIPAFIEARIRPVDGTLVAGADVPQVWTVDTPVTGWGQDTATLVASAFGDRSEVFTSPLVEHPHADVFAARHYDAYTPVTVDKDGRIGGHVIPWGECHIGFAGRCVMVGASDNAYRYARTGHVLTQEGDLVPTARVYAQFRTGRRAHAPENLTAADAVAWYEEMSQAVADVVIYDDQHGMQIQGRVRPGITQHQLIALRASDLSPDWRAIRGKRECLAIAAVNVSGYPSRYDRLPALVASAVEQGVDIDLVTMLARQIEGRAYVDDGRVVTLVASAANVNRPERSFNQALAARIAAVETELAALRDERYREKAAQVLAGLDFTPEEDELAALVAEQEAAAPDEDPDDPDGEDEDVPAEELAAWADAALDGLEELHGPHHHDQSEHNSAPDPKKKAKGKAKAADVTVEAAGGLCPPDNASSGPGSGAPSQKRRRDRQSAASSTCETGCTTCDTCRAAATTAVS